MVEQESSHTLTALFKAASDPTRRDILTLLAQHGPLKVTDISARYDLSLNAISKHIKVLEQAGLVTRRTEWRDHLIQVQLDRVQIMNRWFDDLRSIWALRLEALDTLLTDKDAAK